MKRDEICCKLLMAKNAVVQRQHLVFAIVSHFWKSAFKKRPQRRVCIQQIGRCLMVKENLKERTILFLAILNEI
jgi:hypothetical protein